MIINDNVELYMTSPRVKQKSQVITSVIEYMETILGAKFVKLDQEQPQERRLQEKNTIATNKRKNHTGGRRPLKNKYIALNQRETHDKVGHAFRDAVKRHTSSST